ncbi:MAG: restriction endonuclease subunit S [Armatimonadetes bacterium]|nr:restriction endonuclease subunit S [Armatimonadota bacterium]
MLLPVPEEEFAMGTQSLRAIAAIRNPEPNLTASTGFAVVRPRKVNPDYLSHVLTSRYFVESVVSVSTGVSYPATNPGDLMNLLVPIPPADEQESIANFLDGEIARIDNLIAKKRELIERLKEKRTALISHVVTKGLPPEEAAKHGLPVNPPLKPSGVPWLGDIPEHWETLDLKYIASVNDDDWPETTAPDTEVLYVDIGSVDGTNGIREKEVMIFENAPSRARRRVRDGDIIVSTVRTYLRAIAPIREPEPNLTVSTGFAVVRPQKADPDYLAQVLTTHYFVESVVSISTGVSYPATNPNDLMNLVIPLPPTKEQIAISEFLVIQCSKIDQLVGLERSLIEKLQEYRSALITAAVTGKIDVSSGKVS